MDKHEQLDGLIKVARPPKPTLRPSKTVDDTTLAAQAMSLGLTPVRAFVLATDKTSPDAARPTIEQAGNRKKDATRTAKARAVWREKGFNQLVLVVPDSEKIRGAFRALEADLKSGASWSQALCRDPTIASLMSSKEDLVRQLSISRKLLEKCQHDLVEARLLAKPRSLLDMSRAGFGAVRAIVDSVFKHRRYEAK